MDDQNPLMVKSSSEVMLSYFQKLVQVYFDNVGYHFRSRIFSFHLILTRILFAFLISLGGVSIHISETLGF